MLVDAAGRQHDLPRALRQMSRGGCRGSRTFSASERLLLLLEGLPHELIRRFGHNERPSILEIDAARHPPVPATAGDSVDAASVQGDDDKVDAVVSQCPAHDR